MWGPSPRRRVRRDPPPHRRGRCSRWEASSPPCGVRRGVSSPCSVASPRAPSTVFTAASTRHEPLRRKGFHRPSRSLRPRPGPFNRCWGRGTSATRGCVASRGSRGMSPAPRSARPSPSTPPSRTRRPRTSRCARGTPTARSRCGSSIRATGRPTGTSSAPSRACSRAGWPPTSPATRRPRARPTRDTSRAGTSPRWTTPPPSAPGTSSSTVASAPPCASTARRAASRPTPGPSRSTPRSPAASRTKAPSVTSACCAGTANTSSSSPWTTACGPGSPPRSRAVTSRGRWSSPTDPSPGGSRGCDATCWATGSHRGTPPRATAGPAARVRRLRGSSWRATPRPRASR